MLYFSPFILALLGTTAVLAQSEFRISTVDGLIDFANKVNSGTYSGGQTVLLDADLNFDDTTSSRFTPIGTSPQTCFIGTFNGQGHVINGLKVTTGYSFSGLFGYTEGLSLKNIVLGSGAA